MAKTRTQFRKQVLANLGVLAAGQDPEAEDSARVDDTASAAFAWLEKAGIYGGQFEYVNDDISDAGFMALSRFVANELAPIYGIPYSEAAREAAEKQIYRAFSSGPTYATLPAEYY